MKVRKIPEGLPKNVWEEAEERYFDTKTSYQIAVKKIDYKGKQREMIVVYDEKGYEVWIVTVHPLKSYEKQARIKSGSGREYEKKPYYKL
jgi:hypothetical protein